MYLKPCKCIYRFIDLVVRRNNGVKNQIARRCLIAVTTISMVTIPYSTSKQYLPNEPIVCIRKLSDSFGDQHAVLICHAADELL